MYYRSRVVGMRVFTSMLDSIFYVRELGFRQYTGFGKYRVFFPEEAVSHPAKAYVEAMLKVYSECYKVLKSSGKIIVIVKLFIRKKQVVDLPYHMYRMLEKTGFKTVEVLKYRLRRMSFWRILYYKKYVDVPRIMHEYILVMEK